MNLRNASERRVEIETWAEEDYQIVLKWMVENRAPEKIRHDGGDDAAEFGGEVEAQTPYPALSPSKTPGRGRRQRFYSLYFYDSMLKI